MKKIIFLSLFFIWLVSSVLFFLVIPISNAFAFPQNIYLTQDEYINSNIPAGRFITQNNNADAICSDADQKYIDLKLFGLFKVKRIKVDILPYESLNLGGVPVGFVAKTSGLIVLEDMPNKRLKKGDIITSLNKTPVNSVEEFNAIVNARMAGSAEQFEVGFIRDGKRCTANIEYNFDGSTRALGLWLKDETSGVGMLTYVNPKNNNFAALGHKLSDHETGARVDVRGGDVYCCNVLGVEKSSNKRVGEFRSALKQSSGKQGSVLSSNDGGIFGCLNADSALLKSTLENYPVGSRYSVRPGAAKIRTCIDGITVEEFNIEIVKAHYQKNRGTKSMVIRITDKKLLERTGGIIHGMSGSPIIQKGKIVGAVTHVMVNDTTKGYGIYIDFIMP